MSSIRNLKQLVVRPNVSSAKARRSWRAVMAVLFFLTLPLPALSAGLCPFCNVVAATFAEQIDSSDLVVVARLVSEPESKDKTQLPRAMFEVSNILKGQSMIKVNQKFKAVVVSRKIQIGDKFLVMGNGNDSINWSTPQLVSDAVVEYLGKLDELPKKGPDRLEFFAGYFEHQETMLAYDAYDEFAKAPYADVKGLKGRVKPERLLVWLKNPDVMKSRKRLYYTLLGVCGGEAQLPFLEDVITSGDRDRQGGLNALIACYLTLKGDDGVDLIEKTFLNNPNAEYIDIFSAITALRFHGTESDILSKPRIVKALQYVLDRPRMADMVIPDLARWEDWSVVNKLVEMFKECDTDETRWVRTPIISYLQACPKPEAKTYLAELREIDPNAAKRADMLAELDWGDDDEDDDENDEIDVVDGGDAGSDSKDNASQQQKGSDKNDQVLEIDAKSGGSSNKPKNNRDQDRFSANDPAVTTVITASAPDAAYVSTVVGDGPKPTPVDPASPTSPTGQTGPKLAELEAGGEPALIANQQLAQTIRPNSPAAVVVPNSPATWMILVGGLGLCAVIFLLLWSVLNGSFERLIS